MDDIKKEYYIEDSNEVKAFHKSRRMFCIYDGKLRIANKNVPYSHAVWFQNENWMIWEKDELMNTIPRGIVDNKGDVYFYVGYNFEINNTIESIFFSCLAELVKKLNLNIDAQIFGGLIKGEPGTMWMPIKSYGKIMDKIEILKNKKIS